jgi:hypothetical protein
MRDALAGDLISELLLEIFLYDLLIFLNLNIRGSYLRGKGREVLLLPLQNLFAELPYATFVACRPSCPALIHHLHVAVHVQHKILQTAA